MAVIGLETLMNQAWDLLMDETTRSFAICGRGGIGKTTFMRQLFNKLVLTQHCETLIWVTVSSNSTPVKIQDDISKTLGIFDSKWIHSSFVEKSQLIRDELSEKKFVLFLDDVWRRIDLIELGIPRFVWYTPNQLIQKFIITTRYEAVADHMNVHSILAMNVLSMVNSLKLFMSKVGDDDIFDDPRISELPEILARRCLGLPILLCTLGRAMASKKTSREWLDALLKIRRLEGTDTQLNSLLQFCFDCLPNHRIKCCLIYFSLFPEDFTILKNDLIDFWVCEHLLDEYDTENHTLDLGYSAIQTLIRAGLMEEEDDDRVKLLDITREFASSVAIKCQMFKRAQLIEATPKTLVSHVGWPSTMGNFEHNLINASHDLFAFLLNHNPFTMMKLQVLHRLEIEIAQSVPMEEYTSMSIENFSEFSQYKNNVLTVLDLSYSGVEEVPREISSLVSLQYLNLSHTWIDRLPTELNMLAKLKCLNLEYNDQLRVIPRQLMYSLSSLQVLKMFRCGYSVEQLGDNILSVRDMDIDPLLGMQHLKVLSITVTCASALHELFSNIRLQNCIQSMSLEVFWDSKSLDISPIAAMKNLLTLEIHQAEVLEELNFKPLQPSVGSFRRLHKITLVQCSNLRELTWVILASNLKVLTVESCEKMEEIINEARVASILKGGEDVEPFAELEILSLEHAYQATVARYSPNGEWVASGDVSGTVRIWGAYNDHVLKKEFKVLNGRIDDLQWSPDGLRIVACGDGKGKSLVRAFMWDSGTNVGEFDGHSRRVLSCAFKPSRPFRIVTCGEDYLVNFYEGPPFKFKLSLRDHSNFANCVRFSPDGSKFISVSSDKKGMLFDGKTGQKIGELSSENGHKGSIYAVSWSPDGKQVLTASADKSAKVWEICDDGTGKLKKTLTCPGSGGVEDMLVGCLWQNGHIVTVSLGGTISIFPASDLDKTPGQISGHMKNVTSLAVLKSVPKTILSSSYDGLIVKWIQGVGYSGKLQRKENSQIKCLAASEEEIVTSGFDNKIWRARFQGDQCGDADFIDIGSQPKDLSLAHQNPEFALVTIDSGIVMIRGTKVISTINLGFSVTASVITPDGSEAIIGGQDGKLHIYSITGDTLREEAILEKHRGAISAIRYSPDLSMFVSGDANREAIVWDRLSREVKLKNMLYHTARINCVAWSPDSTMVATGSLDTCVIIYEIEKPTSSRMTIKGAHLGGVYGLAFADEQNVVSSGEDACVRVWNLSPQ